MRDIHRKMNNRINKSMKRLFPWLDFYCKFAFAESLGKGEGKGQLFF